MVWIALLASGTAAYPYISYLSPDPVVYGYMGVFNGIMTIGIPILALLFVIIRFFGPYRLKRIWHKRMWAFWALNVLVFIGIAINFAMNRQSETEIEESLVLDPFVSDTIQIITEKPGFSQNGFFNIYFMEVRNRKLLVENVRLRIEKSEDEQFRIEKEIRSYGKTHADARERAEEVDCSIEVRDNQILVPSYFELSRGDKYKDQSVLYTVFIPEGKTVKLSEDVRHYLYSSSFDNHFDLPRQYERFTWQMGQNGLISNDWISKIKFSEEIQLTDFSRVSVEGNFEVDIIRADQYRISVEGNEDAVKDIEKVKVENGLYLSTEVNRFANPLKLYISIPELESLKLSRTGKSRIEGFEQDQLKLEAINTGDIKADIKIGQLTLEIDGRSEIELKGEGNTLDAALFSGASINASQYITQNAYLRGHHHHGNKISVSDTIFNYLNRQPEFKIFGSPVIINKTEEE